MSQLSPMLSQVKCSPQPSVQSL